MEGTYYVVRRVKAEQEERGGQAGYAVHTTHRDGTKVTHWESVEEFEQTHLPRDSNSGIVPSGLLHNSIGQPHLMVKEGMCEGVGFPTIFNGAGWEWVKFPEPVSVDELQEGTAYSAVDVAYDELRHRYRDRFMLIIEWARGGLCPEIQAERMPHPGIGVGTEEESGAILVPYTGPLHSQRPRVRCGEGPQEREGYFKGEG